jgi:hypothetical protein
MYFEMSKGVICNTTGTFGLTRTTMRLHRAVSQQTVRSAFQFSVCFSFSGIVFHPLIGVVIVFKCLVEKYCQLLT